MQNSKLYLINHNSAVFQAQLTINRGKDFKGDQIEVIGQGSPGAFMSLNGYHSKLYERGGNAFIDEEKVT